MLPRALPLFAFTALLTACSLFSPKLEKPTLTVVGVRMVHGDLLQQTFRVTLKIYNPNDRVIPIQGVSAELRVGGEVFASGASTDPIVLPALGDTQFDMTITAELALGIMKLSKQLSNHADSIDYELTGAVRLKSRWIKNLPFHQTGALSLKNVPN